MSRDYGKIRIEKIQRPVLGRFSDFTGAVCQPKGGRGGHSQMV